MFADFDYVDKMAVVIKASIPASTLNKKHIALVYHCVREHVANKVVTIIKIDSKDNCADTFTKSHNSSEHGNFYHELLCNYFFYFALSRSKNDYFALRRFTRY